MAFDRSQSLNCVLIRLYYSRTWEDNQIVPSESWLAPWHEPPHLKVGLRACAAAVLAAPIDHGCPLDRWVLKSSDGSAPASSLDEMADVCDRTLPRSHGRDEVPRQIGRQPAPSASRGSTSSPSLFPESWAHIYGRVKGKLQTDRESALVLALWFLFVCWARWTRIMGRGPE